MPFITSGDRRGGRVAFVLHYLCYTSFESDPDSSEPEYFVIPGKLGLVTGAPCENEIETINKRK